MSLIVIPIGSAAASKTLPRDANPSVEWWQHPDIFTQTITATVLNSLQNKPYINGLIVELQYPTHKMVLYNSGGVSSSKILVSGIQIKNGNQQITKTPMTIPNVTATLGK